MFTGLVQEVAKVVEFSGHRLSIEKPPQWEDLGLGESISVNGCCLTLVSQPPLAFDTTGETLSRTTIGSLIPGQEVNLERAMRLSDRLGGHIVQGHVDSIGKVVRVSTAPGGHLVHFDVGAEFDRYLIDKGSVCLDGISLTVVNPKAGVFSVAVIPETWERTNLSRAVSGTKVNVEFDVLARHVEKLLSSRLSPA